MITDRARTGFDTLIHAALRSGLDSAAGPCRIETVKEVPRLKRQRIVVLTVSSYLFRLLAIVYFRDDAATRSYFAGRSGGEGDAEPATLSDQEFLDRVAERGNMLCGSLNRDLGRHFPHVGMSTPNVLDRDCMRYVDLLGCGLQRHYQLALPGDVAMHATLCVSDYGTVDFHAPPAEEAAEAVSTGELEFF